MLRGREPERFCDMSDVMVRIGEKPLRGLKPAFRQICVWRQSYDLAEQGGEVAFGEFGVCGELRNRESVGWPL